MKNNNPNRFILAIRPKEYLVQGPSHCGAYSLKGILSAFNKDTKDHPTEYHTNLVSKLTGTGFGKSYWTNILKKCGVKAKLNSASNLNPEEKILLLKSLLANNTPVMIRIGNGYFRSKKYNPFLGRIITHWITLWGYDDEKQEFYIYDSGLSKELYDEVPIGNTKRTYKEILRDWNIGPWQPWTWHNTWENYIYIEINKT